MVRQGCRLLAAGLIAGLALAGTPAHAAFPGDNGRIAYQGYRNLGTVNAGGGDRVPLISGVDGVFFGGPTWSADGQRLAFSSNRDGTDSEIYVASADGSSVIAVTNNAFDDDAPSGRPTAVGSRSRATAAARSRSGS